MIIFLKSEMELDTMHHANRLVLKVLDAVQKAAAPGVSTGELDEMAEQMIVSEGATPAFKGYRGNPAVPPFPATLCVSRNDVIVHGIPGRKDRLQSGDIISVDCGVILDGFVGDAAVTFPVGEVNAEARRLIETTRKCLGDAIEQVRPGNRIGDISAAVQQRAEGAGFGVVREFVGHGVGKSMHEAPQIPNYGKPGQGRVLKQGLVIAIEPMVTEGSWRVKIDNDGWTARTEDGKLAAHFEFSVAVTAEGHRVLGLEE